MVENAQDAYERGDFGPIIPGSRFQIRALVSNKPSSASGTKKKKKKTSAGNSKKKK